MPPRMVIAPPDQLARISTRFPSQSEAGERDQSERPCVTTAPALSCPSENSVAAFTQTSSLARMNSPAWSNCSENAAVYSTSIAHPGLNGAMSAFSVSWTKP